MLTDAQSAVTIKTTTITTFHVLTTSQSYVPIGTRPAKLPSQAENKTPTENLCDTIKRSTSLS